MKKTPITLVTDTRRHFFVIIGVLFFWLKPFDVWSEVISSILHDKIWQNTLDLKWPEWLVLLLLLLHTWAWEGGLGDPPYSRWPYPPFRKWTHQDDIPPIQGFPKIFGNKNAIISKNSPRKIDPPFRNFGLCSKDPPPWKKSHAHVWSKSKNITNSFWNFWITNQNIIPEMKIEYFHEYKNW